VVRQVVLTKVRGEREGQVQQLALADRTPQMETQTAARSIFAGGQLIED
jgi:hypothetical protein